MKNNIAKYLISRAIKTTKIQEKINKSSDTVAIKYLIIMMGDNFVPKDFHYFIKLCLKDIEKGLSTLDIEPIMHSLDILTCAKQITLGNYRFITEIEEIVGMIDKLNAHIVQKLAIVGETEASQEFFDGICNFYATLIADFDEKLVTHSDNFTEFTFVQSSLKTSACALNYFKTFINAGGNYITMDDSVELIIDYFNSSINMDLVENENQRQITMDEKYVFLDLIKVLHMKNKLGNENFQKVMDYIEAMVKIFENIKLHDVNEELIFLMIYLIDTLGSLAENSNGFKNVLDKVLAFEFLPHLISKAYNCKNSKIIYTLLSLTRIENFPNAKVANLLSRSNKWFENESSYKEYQKRCELNTKNTKYINKFLLQELDELITKINKKIDNNELETLKKSDVIELYRQKNNYLTDHLNKVNASIDKYAEECRSLQQQNTELRKLGEKQEVTHWCLELDNEALLRENQNLEKEIFHMKGSIEALGRKSEKEIADNVKVRKLFKVQEAELKSEWFKFSKL
jgi:hypothetical protein